MILDSLIPNVYPEVRDSDYIFNGTVVPRVTKILSDMLHEDGLMSWSNYIGLVKHQKYQDVLQQAADKGTYVHNSIEDYMQNDQELNINKVPDMYQVEVNNAYSSFLLWWQAVCKNKYEILMQEQPLVCQWYGGTLDLLIKINDKIYLADFKTSNHLSYKYIMQLAAYRYMLRILHGIEVDGLIIIKLEKQSVNFTEMVLDCHDQDDLDMINHAEAGFHAIVYGWYERKYLEEKFKEKEKENGEG